MKKIKTYLAFSTDNRAYICEAYSKKQMKIAGMNMKLIWQERESYEKAKNEILCSEYTLTNSSNVSNFGY